jgi:hypothetical protein
MVLLLLSCSGNPKQQPSLVGKWIYDRLEKAVNTTPSIAEKINKDNKGHTIEFDASGKYISLRTPTDTNETGTWEMIREGKMVITHTNGTGRIDSMKIAELTDDLVKVMTPNEDIYVMKKVH